MGLMDTAFRAAAAEPVPSLDAVTAVAPDADALEAATRAVFGRLPEDLAPRYAALPIEILDLPEPERLEALGLSDPFDLIGHFESAEPGADGADPVLAPSRLFVFRRPLLDYWVETGGSLSEALSDVLIGEIERRIAAGNEIAAETAA